MKINPNSAEFKQIIREEAMRLKKRIMLENEKKAIVKVLMESGYMDEEELNEFLGFGGTQSKQASLEKYYKDHVPAWSTKGYAAPNQQEYAAEMQKAAQDKYEGLWGVNQQTKKIVYRPSNTIKWGTGSTEGGLSTGLM